MQETWARSLGREDPLEEEMATRSSILAWETPWTEDWQATVLAAAKESDMTEHRSCCPHCHFLPWQTNYKGVNLSSG